MIDTCRPRSNVDPARPALSGPFPVHPVWPGVVILERVAAAWKAWRGTRPGTLDVKCPNPLASAVHAHTGLRADGDAIAFRVTGADGVAFARGRMGALP